jgi:hypothetical protein
MIGSATRMVRPSRVFGKQEKSCCSAWCRAQTGALPPQRQCEPTGWREAPPDDRRREAIHFAAEPGPRVDCFVTSSRNDGVDGSRRHLCARLVMSIRPDKGAVHERY